MGKHGKTYRKISTSGTGALPWPPLPISGGSVYQSTRDAWGNVLWTLAHSGPIVDEHGLAMQALRELLAQPHEITRLALPARVNELVDMGLVELDRPSKRTDRKSVV